VEYFAKGMQEPEDLPAGVDGLKDFVSQVGGGHCTDGAGRGEALRGLVREEERRPKLEPSGTIKRDLSRAFLETFRES
jgi:hypothetical protein